MASSTPRLQTRQLAVEILNRVRRKGRTLDYWLAWADGHQKQLDTRDRAFIRSLVYGTLRWQRRLDWVIDQTASRKAKTIDPVVRAIMQLGLFQLLYLDRVPASAAVYSCVELTRHFKRPWASGFVNKVLRRAISEIDQIPWPTLDQDPVLAMAVSQSFPEWLIESWIRHWGIENTLRLCLALNRIPLTTLRTNTLKTTRSELKEILHSEFQSIRETDFSPEGIAFLEPAGAFTEQPVFNQGLFQIQDEASQLVSHLLDPLPGQLVWDACAGLGTKTGHLAQIMINVGRIMATDARPDKLTRLSQEMTRLGISIVKPDVLDLTHSEAINHLPQFDRILLDAPCSGTGVLRKNPDAKWSLRPEDLLRHQKQQLFFLEKTARCLKPGGILVYAVCSMASEEAECVIEEFLRKQEEFVIYRRSLEKIPNSPKLMTPSGCLRTLPHEHEMDGFFAAALIKRH